MIKLGVNFTTMGIAAGGTIGAGMGIMLLMERKRKRNAEMLINGYKIRFGIDHDQDFDMTIEQNEHEYAIMFEKELNEFGYEYKAEELKSPNKWLFAACYFKVGETKSLKQKLQFLKFLFYFNTTVILSTNVN